MVLSCIRIRHNVANEALTFSLLQRNILLATAQTRGKHPGPLGTENVLPRYLTGKRALIVSHYAESVESGVGRVA